MPVGVGGWGREASAYPILVVLKNDTSKEYTGISEKALKAA